MFLNLVKKLWEWLNKISPANRNLIIILLLGFIFYSQITQETKQFIYKVAQESVITEKEAEEYTKNTAVDVNRHVRLIAHKDDQAFDVLLLSYHNSKQSLQGFKYLYLSCITEAPKTIDTPLIGTQWSNLDYIYYADELEKIHNQEIVHISNINNMRRSLPKLYRLIESSEANSASFYIIEGKDSPIGIIVALYKETNIDYIEKAKIVMPSIQKLAILLDYDNR